MVRSRSSSNASTIGGNSMTTSSSSYTTMMSSSTLLGGYNTGGNHSEYNMYQLSSTEITTSFNQMLINLQRSSSSLNNNTKSIRLAACCAALIETAQEQRRNRSVGTSTSNGSEGEEVQVTPNEMFVATLSALSSLQGTLETQTPSSSDTTTSTTANDDHQSSSSSSINNIIENTAIPLLEILRHLFPYVSHYTNNNGILLLHQFGTVSRMLRMFVTLGYALPSTTTSDGIGGGGGGGGVKKKKKRKKSSQQLGTTTTSTTGTNALLRQLLKTTTTFLLTLPPSSTSHSSNFEKDVAKLLHSTILQMALYDVRPKVRKAGWGCCLEIIIVASSSSSSSASIASSLGSSDTNNMNTIKKEVQTQRKVIADFIWEYCHAILDNFTTTNNKKSSSSSSSSSNNNDTNNNNSKVVHVLRFLSTSLPYSDDTRIQIKFGELVCTCLSSIHNKQQGGGSGSGDNNVELVKELLGVLLSSLEMSELEQQQQQQHDNGIGVDTTNNNNVNNTNNDSSVMSKFASRTCAFLLSHRPNNAQASSSSGDDVNITYGRCLLACMERMLGNNTFTSSSSSSSVNDNKDEEEVSASKLLAFKLLPNIMTSILHLCEAHGGTGGGEEDNGNDNTSCGSEFNQFMSRMIPIILSNINGTTTTTSSNNNDDDDGGSSNEEEKMKLHRIALEVLPQCIPILQSSLSIKYRNSWGSILSGGYSTFVTLLSRCLLILRYRQQKESSGSSISSSGGDGEGSSSELEEMLQTNVQTLVTSMLQLHTDIPKNDKLARTAVEYATSTIIRGVGLELFMSVVDFDNNVNDDIISSGDGGDGGKKKGGGIREDRAWLLPLMKSCATSTSTTTTHYEKASGGGIDSSGSSITTKTHLSFFQTNILSLARKCDAASADGQRTVAESCIQKERVIELWSLLPAFCVYPMDMTENFSMFAKIVVKALGDYERYPKLVPIIAGGLKLLTIGVMERANATASQTATDDYDVLSNTSTKILPSLFKLVETLNQSSSSSATTASNQGDEMEVDDTATSAKRAQSKSQQSMQLVEAVTDAIGHLAQVCPREFLQTLVKKVLQRLLVATTTESSDASSNDKNANTTRMSSLLGLGQALVASGSLDETSLSLLYRAVRPLVRTDEHDPRVQKRAYKVLAEICERHNDFVTSPERLGEMIDVLVDSIVTCQVSARHMRLKCMTHIVEGFDSTNTDHMEVIPKIMGEVLLCLKDSNAKTREAAYQLLLAMAASRDDMTDYFTIVMAALGAQTTHMRSAAVMALSRLTYEYAREDVEVQQLLPSIMQTVAVLFDDSSREVTKSVIGFVRVSVAAMTPEQLEPLLPEIVGGIMKYNKGKDRFRAKIKIILKKLVRVYGYDAIAPLVPPEHTRLITHMRKISERSARRKAAGVQDGRSVAKHHQFDDMMESDEDDSDDGRTFVTGVTGFTRMTNMTGKTTKRSAMERSVKGGKSLVSAMTSKSANERSGPRIKAELQGEILDLLDTSIMARSVRFADADMNDRDLSDDDDDDGMDDMQFDNQGRIVISDGMPNLGGNKNVNYDSADEDEDLEENLELKAGGKRRRISKFESVKLAKAEQKGKKQKTKKEPTTSLGAAYKSKKAGGDVKKKGQKFEPYAFVPLNAKDYTKKNRSGAVSKMASVVRSNKRKR